MFVFKIIIFICLYEHVGDAEVLTVSLRDHNMWLRDHFGGVTNLFISGRNLTFPCVCEQEACKRMVVKLDTDTKVKSDGKERKYHELPMTLTHNTEFGEYICETNNVKSKTLKLNYLLCDDRDDICNSLSCPQARNVDGYFYFCVLKENFRSPITCELLNETNCPDETFGSWMGYPCLENGDKGTSLCHAFAKKEKVVFLSVKAETDCKDSDLLKVTSPLKRGERIYLGSISEYGSYFEFSCKSDCALQCSVNTYEDIDERGFVKGNLSLRRSNASLVSRIYCFVKSGSFIDIYFFTVLFSVSMEFKIDSAEISCRLLKPPFSDQGKLFKYFVAIFCNGKPFMETKTETQLKVVADICGTYHCEVWMAVKHCAPHYEKNDRNTSGQILISENCTIPFGDVPANIIFTVGGILCTIVSFGFIGYGIYYMFSQKKKSTLKKFIKSKKKNSLQDVLSKNRKYKTPNITEN